MRSSRRGFVLIEGLIVITVVLMVLVLITAPVGFFASWLVFSEEAIRQKAEGPKMLSAAVAVVLAYVLLFAEMVTAGSGMSVIDLEYSIRKKQWGPLLRFRLPLLCLGLIAMLITGMKAAEAPAGVLVMIGAGELAILLGAFCLFFLCPPGRSSDGPLSDVDGSLENSSLT